MLSTLVLPTHPLWDSLAPCAAAACGQGIRGTLTRLLAVLLVDAGCCFVDLGRCAGGARLAGDGPGFQGGQGRSAAPSPQAELVPWLMQSEQQEHLRRRGWVGVENNKLVQTTHIRYPHGCLCATRKDSRRFIPVLVAGALGRCVAGWVSRAKQQLRVDGGLCCLCRTMATSCKTTRCLW